MESYSPPSNSDRLINAPVERLSHDSISAHLAGSSRRRLTKVSGIERLVGEKRSSVRLIVSDYLDQSHLNDSAVIGGTKIYDLDGAGR